MNFIDFFYVVQNTISEKKLRGYTREIISSITQKILACDMAFWYKKISKIRNVSFIFQNFQKNV